MRGSEGGGGQQRVQETQKQHFVPKICSIFEGRGGPAECQIIPFPKKEHHSKEVQDRTVGAKKEPKPGVAKQKQMISELILIVFLMRANDLTVYKQFETLPW